MEHILYSHQSLEFPELHVLPYPNPLHCDNKVPINNFYIYFSQIDDPIIINKNQIKTKNIYLQFQQPLFKFAFQDDQDTIFISTYTEIIVIDVQINRQCTTSQTSSSQIYHQNQWIQNSQLTHQYNISRFPFEGIAVSIEQIGSMLFISTTNKNFKFHLINRCFEVIHPQSMLQKIIQVAFYPSEKHFIGFFDDNILIVENGILNYRSLEVGYGIYGFKNGFLCVQRQDNQIYLFDLSVGSKLLGRYAGFCMGERSVALYSQQEVKIVPFFDGQDQNIQTIISEDQLQKIEDIEGIVNAFPLDFQERFFQQPNIEEIKNVYFKEKLIKQIEQFSQKDMTYPQKIKKMLSQQFKQENYITGVFYFRENFFIARNNYISIILDKIQLPELASEFELDVYQKYKEPLILNKIQVFKPIQPYYINLISSFIKQYINQTYQQTKNFNNQQIKLQYEALNKIVYMLPKYKMSKEHQLCYDFLQVTIQIGNCAIYGPLLPIRFVLE